MKNDGAAVTSVPIDAAPADLLDRITVLEIKSARLTTDEQLRNVRAELTALCSVRDRWISPTSDLDRLTIELRKTNEMLWDLEEAVRRWEAARDWGEAFIESARAIIHSNNRRAALKRAINDLLGARYQEERSYPLPDPAAPGTT
jgi:hypothetical protein